MLDFRKWHKFCLQPPNRIVIVGGKTAEFEKRFCLVVCNPNRVGDAIKGDGVCAYALTELNFGGRGYKHRAVHNLSIHPQALLR